MRSKSERHDIYDTITNKIITAIETGVDEWQMPWHRPGSNFSIPKNDPTNQHYRGTYSSEWQRQRKHCLDRQLGKRFGGDEYATEESPRYPQPRSAAISKSPTRRDPITRSTLSGGSRFWRATIAPSSPRSPQRRVRAPR